MFSITYVVGHFVGTKKTMWPLKRKLSTPWYAVRGTFALTSAIRPSFFATLMKAFCDPRKGPCSPRPKAHPQSRSDGYTSSKHQHRHAHICTHAQARTDMLALAVRTRYTQLATSYTPFCQVMSIQPPTIYITLTYTCILHFQTRAVGE